MDEGKFTRGKSSMAPGRPKPAPSSAAATEAGSEPRRTAAANNKEANEKMVKAFITKNKEKIREKFGDRKVEFKVKMKDGKQTISVRAKD